MEYGKAKYAAVSKEDMAESCRALADYTKGVAKLRHDMKSHLLAVRSILKQGDTERAIRYIDGLYEQDQEIPCVTLTRNLPVSVVLNSRLRVCSSRGIAADTQNISLPETLPFPDGDIVSILSNLLDNAITAAAAAPRGERSIRLEMRIRDGYLCIRMENGTAAEKESAPPCPLHGHGLDIIRSIAEKHRGHALFKREGSRFTSSVVLYMGE